MLVGSGDPKRLEEGAPTVEKLETEAVAFSGADVLQVLCEMESGPMCEMLPPSLHPSLPPIVNWGVYRLPSTPWGPVHLAQTRIQCRSGLRPRGLLVSAVCDVEEAATELANRFGYRVQHGDIDFETGYAGTHAEVEVDGETILSLGLRDPTVLPHADVQYVSSLHPAHSPRGFRLLQIDLAHLISGAARGVPVIDHFDAEAWGEARIRPSYAVSASLAHAHLTLQPLRFVCRADVSAFEGTEPV